jgi:hypothetical protein
VALIPGEPLGGLRTPPQRIVEVGEKSGLVMIFAAERQDGANSKFKISTVPMLIGKFS